MVAGLDEAGLVVHILGPSKQVFWVHPTEASETGIPHRKYEDLKKVCAGS